MNKENKTYLYLEILQGSFLLHFKLPKNEEIYEVKKKMDNSLMNFIIPKIPIPISSLHSQYIVDLSLVLSIHMMKMR